MTRRTNGTFRPDLTSHADIITAIRELINQEALYEMSDTDICKIAIEKMFERAFGKKPVSKARKVYIRVNL